MYHTSTWHLKEWPRRSAAIAKMSIAAIEDNSRKIKQQSDERH
jgi:hypothetical protein